MINKLDNPVWFSLLESHKDFSINYDEVKFYHPDYCPFGGYINKENTKKAAENYTKLASNFFIVGDKPSISNKIRLKQELVCNQMVLEIPIDLKIEEGLTQIGEEEKQQLLDLVNLVQPGYFKENTIKLGDYYGIFKNQQLVAVTGERMKMNHFTEISAVITHPEHTGKGYAKQLVARVANKVFEQNKTPYLHVAESNIGAIKLYEKLGFKTRRKIGFWNLRKSEVRKVG